MINTAHYWDERTLLIYGILGGYTQLSHEEVVKTVNKIVNLKGNVKFCIDLLATLEAKQKIRSIIWLDLRKYQQQLNEQPESDERSELISKVQDIADWEVDERNVLGGSFAGLLEWDATISKGLYGCIYFDLEILAKNWIHGVVQEYLEQFKQNKLFTPTAGIYKSYHQQYVDLTDYFDRPKPRLTVPNIFFPEKLRLPELLYDFVDQGKLTIEGFSEFAKDEADNETVSFIVKTYRDKTSPKLSQRIDDANIKLDHRSYDAANGILTIHGEQIAIIRQKNMKGMRKEKKPAQLMRALFSPNTFPDPIPIRQIYPVDAQFYKGGEIYTPRVVNKASSLVTDINELFQEKFEGKKLIEIENSKFKIVDRYLKK